jgi:hypothetical protein
MLLDMGVESGYTSGDRVVDAGRSDLGTGDNVKVTDAVLVVYLAEMVHETDAMHHYGDLHG